MITKRFPLQLGTVFALVTVFAFSAMMLLGFATNFLAPQPRTVIPHILLFLLICTPVLAVLGLLLALFYFVRDHRWRYCVAALACVAVLLFLVCTMP